MTNRIAVALLILIALFLLADYLVYDLAVSLFLARKLADLLEYLAFWR